MVLVPLTPTLLIACATGVAAEGSRRQVESDDRASVAFIDRVGFLAHLDHEQGTSSWPLPEVSRAMEWARYGLDAGVLHTQPAPGDIALRWDARRSAFVHAAIVAYIENECRRIVSGSEREVRCRLLFASGSGARARFGTFRPSLGDRFLRWADLKPAEQHGRQDESRGEHLMRRAA